MNNQTWSIQEVASMVGTTSRTLRHYDDIGLLPPAEIGSNGYRCYDQACPTRLQRILLLRDLGLGLAQIGEVLDGDRDDAAALTTYAGWTRQEQDRLASQLASVERTITALTGGKQLMAEEMLDGFDHTQYKDEVEQRWGKSATPRATSGGGACPTPNRHRHLPRSTSPGSASDRAARAQLVSSS